MSESLSFRDYILSTSGVPLFVGNVFGLILYGALTVQLYLYYALFPDDPWSLKAVIYLVYVTETVYTVLLLYDLENIIFNSATNIFLSPTLIIICGGIAAFLTQAMYAHRIRALGQVKYVPRWIMVLITLELLATIVMSPFIFSMTSYLAFGIPTFTSGPATPIDYFILAWACVSLVIDVTVAGSMLWSLKKDDTLSKRSRAKVAHLVHLVVGTGTLTAAINLVTVILFAAGMPDTIYGSAIVLSKLYANSMMVFLNDRASARYGCGGHAMPDTMTVPLGSLHFASGAGPADKTQEQPVLGECNDAKSMTPVLSKQYDCPA